LKSHDPIDVFKTAGAITIILVIVIASVYYYRVEQERSQQELMIKEEANKISAPSMNATKLVIIITGSNMIRPGKECTLLIRAVNDKGLLDTSRDDAVKTYIKAGPTAKIDKEKVILENGQATVKIVSFVTETVFIYAEWESGRSYLRPGENVVFYT
jgi:hypothetical protein